MNQSAWIRPDWTPATVAMMVLGFVVFWPLGMAMLAYILFGDRLQEFKREANRTVDDTVRSARQRFGRSPFKPGAGTSGNAAFDEWRDKELERIAEERRKLEEMRAEFDAYLNELRQAKDKEEFDRYMRDRRGRNDSDSDAA